MVGFALVVRQLIVDDIQAQSHFGALAITLNTVRKITALVNTYTRGYTVRLALLTVLYLLSTRATDLIPYKGANLSPIWFPTGLALFLLIWWSPKLWPAVFVAGLVMSAPLTAMETMVSLTNALEPAFAAYLFLRIFKTRDRLGDLNGVIGVVAIGGILSPLLSGLVVQICLQTFGHQKVPPELGNWLLWTAGDFNGVVLLTPIFAGTVFAYREWKPWTLKRVVELAITFAVLVFVTGLVFDSWQKIWPTLDLGNEVLGDSFLILPILVWIAIRFTQPLASIAVLIASMMAMWETAHGMGPYAGHSPDKNVIWLHAFIAVVATFVAMIASGKRDRDRTEEALRDSQEQYRFLFENNPHPMWVYSTETLRFITVNEAAIANYGYSRDEFLAMTIRDIRPAEDVPALMQDIQLPEHEKQTREWRHLRKDGKQLNVEISSIGFHRNGSSLRLVLANDITPRRTLEAELRQAQKLEAIGQLAGGVAHDFNNLIMIISNYAELMHQNPEDSARVRKNSEQIMQATDRAAMLTQQLLAFSRKQMLISRVLDLNSVLGDMMGLIRRLIGERIELKFNPEAALWPVKLDVGQLTQVVLNLCANARDAIQGAGELEIRTGNIVLNEDARYGTHLVPCGSYSTLTVKDTGEGIGPEAQEHIFEPFFTTKSRGKGTGLGLATVYGIVRQSGGYIRVASEVGRGSEFTLYFPRMHQTPEEVTRTAINPMESGHESILVAEDQHELRSAVVDSLRSLGYHVVHAMHGKHAIEVADQLPSLDLLLTDVVMPQMGGAELAEHVRKKFPGVKVIFMSGYADGMVQAEHLDADTTFLAKPFSLNALAKNVRELFANGTERTSLKN